MSILKAVTTAYQQGKLTKDQYTELAQGCLSGDPLANYSARDLVSALHWTSKADLKPSLYKPNEIDESWENLMQADQALHRFYDFELAKMIEAYKSREGGN